MLKIQVGNNINFNAITNNTILNIFWNNVSGILSNNVLPKLVPKNTAKNNGINIKYSLK